MQKKKGISLIVLVITIIVMIILAAAVIISLNNSGIIERASSAVKQYNEDEVKHMANLAWSEAYLNPAITTDEQYEAAVTQALQNNGVDISKYDITVTTRGVTVTLKQNSGAQATGWVQDGLTITKGDVTLEAGDLIQYNAGVEGYTGAWKVLGAEDGKLLIMSTVDVNSLKLYGLEGDGSSTNYGLLNGIDRLNEICEAYGSGTGAVGARSIKVEDVDKLTGYDKTTFEANFGTKVYQYGNQVTYSWNTTESGKVDYTSTNGQNGTLSKTHNSGFSYVDFNTMTKTTVAVNGSGMPTLTSDYYNYSVGDTTLPTDSQKATEMIFGEYNVREGEYIYEYWLASPCVFANTNYAYFDLQAVKSGVRRCDLLNSYGRESSGEGGVRAVVSLSSDIRVGTKDNALGWAYSV